MRTRLAALDLAEQVDLVLAVEVAVGNLPQQLIDSRRSVFLRHAGYPGHTGLAAMDENDELVGFCYGYPSRPGTWWRDIITPYLPQADWLIDTFELAELHVHPKAQRHGLGEALLRGVLAETDARRVLLTAKQSALPARRLYARLGFSELANEVRFPGYPEPYLLLGASLPLFGTLDGSRHSSTDDVNSLR